MFATAEERWERIAQGLFVTGCLFVAFAAFGIYSGEDWRAVVMTLAPGAVVFALWYMARARAEHLITGVRMPVAARAIAATVILGSIAFVVHLVRMAPELQVVTTPDRETAERLRQEDMLKNMSKRRSATEMGEVEVTFANGERGKVTSLVRKAPEPEPECADIGVIADPREGHEGEQVEFCKRWATTPP